MTHVVLEPLSLADCRRLVRLAVEAAICARCRGEIPDGVSVREKGLPPQTGDERPLVALHYWHHRRPPVLKVPVRFTLGRLDTGEGEPLRVGLLGPEGYHRNHRPWKTTYRTVEELVAAADLEDRVVESLPTAAWIKTSLDNWREP